MPAAGYTYENMIFDFENPRTDIYHSMYGYSLVEQAVDLITSVINTFIYNAGNFTEKLSAFFIGLEIKTTAIPQK